MALFVFFTGASGSGKTFLTRAVEEKLNMREAYFAYFDEIGVPSHEEMLSQFGSYEKWQEQATYEWVERLGAMTDKRLLFLEGQFDPEFALQACERHHLSNTLFLCAHTSRIIRERRLVELRRQPELANQDMQSWAKFLHDKTVGIGGEVIDTSPEDASKNIERILLIIVQRLQKIKAVAS